MARPITQEERQTLMEHPELVMFMPRSGGLQPVVFLLVIPVATMVALAGILYLSGALFALVESAPVRSALCYVAFCSLMPWVCLHLKTRYDEAYGFDHELRGLLQREGLTVEVVRVTGVVPQRAEVYAEGDEGPFLFGIASTRNAFVPEVGTKLALVRADERCLAVRPDPGTSLFTKDQPLRGVSP